MSRRIATKPQAALHFQVSERTLRNWMGKGLITGYRFGAHDIRVDIDEVEQMLRTVPPTVARDGRKVFGPKARIVDLSKVVQK